MTNYAVYKGALKCRVLPVSILDVLLLRPQRGRVRVLFQLYPRKIIRTVQASDLSKPRVTDLA